MYGMKKYVLLMIKKIIKPEFPHSEEIKIII